MDMYLLEADISSTNVKPNKKKYKCPYCEARIERAKLYLHIQDEHEDLIPEGYTALRVAFNSVNNKTCGHCIICKKETDWNETKGRYERLCNNPGCHEAYKRIVAERNQRIYGTDRLQSDPRYADFVQRKALEGRKMYGKYKFADGGEIAYLGSYERKLLMFLDDVMHCKSEDILAPGPSIVYKYEGVDHTYIPDFYYIPYNLIIEVKDGGTNPNTHPKRMGADRERIHAKEQAVIDERKFNYVRVTNNNFGQLMSVMAALKFSYYYTTTPEEEYVVRANESAVYEDMSGTIAAALAPNPIPHEADKSNYYIVQHPQNNVFAYGITKDPDQSIIYSVDPEEKGFYKAFKTKKGDIEKKYLTFKIKDSQTARELYDELALMEKTGAKVFDESVTSSEFIYRRLTEGSKILSPEQLLFDTRFELVKNPETELQEMCDNLYKWLKAKPIDVLEEQVALLEDYYTDGLEDYNVLPDNIDNLEDLKKWKNRYDSMPFETRMRSDDISLDLYKDTNMNRYTKKMAGLLDMVDPQKNNPIENLNKNTVMVSDLFREGALLESEDKSKLDKNFTKKEVYDLSKYRRIVTDNSSGGIKSDLIVWKDGAHKVGQVFADIDKASDGNRWFGSLEVSKDYRGHGLSEQILDYIINKYKSNALAVYKDNEIAVNLYKKKGFKIVKNAPNLSNEYYTMIRGSHISESAIDSEAAKPDVLYSYEWDIRKEKVKEAEAQGLIIMVHDGIERINNEDDLAAFKEKWNRYQSLPEDKRILSSQTASNIFGLNNENLYMKLLNDYINREEFFKNAGGLGKYRYDEDPSSEPSQYFNPGEEADYISSDATVQNESAAEREKEKKFEQRMESLENLSMRLRNTTNEVKRKILKQQIKARGWNPEIPYNKEAVKRVNEFKFASYTDVEEVDASTLCEAIAAMEDIPKERTSESLKDKIVPVFVILSHGTQLHSKGIMWFTDSEWSHASLALDSSLKEMYTFTANIDNAPNKRHRNGFAIDTVERYMKYDPHMKVKVYALFITPKQREEMRDAIQWYIRHQDDTSYGFKNIMNIFARRITRRKAKDGDKCKMVCSQFVYTILMLVNFRLRKNKDSSLVSPADIDDLSDDARFYVVYHGGIDEYDSKKVDKICYDLLPSLPVEMYGIQEGEGTKMVVNPKSAIGKPNMVNRVLGMADEMLK